MVPIVNGLEDRYGSCLTLERVNLHDHTPWHEKLNPLGSPEFALLDAGGQLLHRWFGFTEAAAFDETLMPLCDA